MSRRRTARTHDDYPTRPDLPLAGRAATHDDDPCPGRCNHAFRRAELEGPDHDVPFHPGRPVWCVDVHAFNDRGEALDRLEHHGCTRTILNRLHDIPTLATALGPGRLSTPRDTDIDHGASKHGGARSIAHAPSPSPGWDTADELIRWAVHLEDTLRARLEDPRPGLRVAAVMRVRTHTLPPGHHGPVGPTVEHRGTGPATGERTLVEAVGYLHRHGTALLSGQGAGRIGQDILDTHRRLERLVGHDRLTHRISEPCPRCKRKGLRRRDGDEMVRCTFCPAVWDWEHLPHLARVYAESVQANGGTA